MSGSERYITLREMMHRMEAGEIFSLEVVSYDKQRGKGGQLRTYLQAQLCTREEDEKRKAKSKATNDDTGSTVSTTQKKPSHRVNHTRNLRLYSAGHPTGSIEKFHPVLVRKFQGLKVL